MNGNRALFKNKGVVLIILWILLMNTCDPSIARHTKGTSTHQLIINIVSSSVLLLLTIMLPFATLVADIKFGGYRFTIGSLMVGFTIAILYFLQHILHFFHINQIAFEIVLELASPFNAIFRKLFTVYMLLYGTDLMPDASSDQLSSFVWWYWCSIYLGHFITVIVTCSGDALLANSMILLAVDIIHFVCLIVILLSCIVFKRRLQLTDNKRKNPLKLIKGTLSFAKRRKSLTYRSALTYCDNESPSKMDFAKQQYGGPFTEEDVESVKSFFRLVPYLLCISLLYFPTVPLGRLSHSTVSTTDCLLSNTYFVEYMIALIVITSNQLLIKPCFASQGFSMFAKVGFGLLLMFLSKVAYAITELYISTSDSQNANFSIPLNGSGMNTSNSYITIYNNSVRYLYLLPQVVGSIGVAIVIPSSFEFIFAQCPFNMRGIVIGLDFAMDEVSEVTGFWSAYVINLGHHPLGHVYIYLSHVIVMLLCLVFFYLIRKKYKFRVRNKVFMYYSAAEEYYTRIN